MKRTSTPKRRAAFVRMRSDSGAGKNYRVIYQIRDEVLLVLVVKVGDRKEVYRRVK